MFTNLFEGKSPDVVGDIYARLYVTATKVAMVSSSLSRISKLLPKRSKNLSLIFNTGRLEGNLLYGICFVRVLTDRSGSA